MMVRDLVAVLLEFDQNLEIEVATCPRKDEWYEVVEVGPDTNHRGNQVLVISTD
jgi:hypothetical protein